MAGMKYLRRYAINLCRDGVRADDLVQETMLRALANRERFEIGTSMNAWLTVICRNLFLSGARKGMRDVEDPDDAMAKSVPVEDSPLKKMEVAELLQLIDKMPDNFRIPLRMVADGASYEEVAFELREHVGTIKSRINRGREMLKSAS
jgi:RNA polymerase sigma-70 factor (ECF subfamily)